MGGWKLNERKVRRKWLEWLFSWGGKMGTRSLDKNALQTTFLGSFCSFHFPIYVLSFRLFLLLVLFIVLSLFYFLFLCLSSFVCVHPFMFLSFSFDTYHSLFFLICFGLLGSSFFNFLFFLTKYLFIHNFSIKR